MQANYMTKYNTKQNYDKNERNLHLKIYLDTIDKILIGTLFHKKTEFTKKE